MAGPDSNAKQNEDEKELVTLYIVRHGETEWNVKDILQGQLDSPLTERGIEQAHKLGERLGDVNFDRVFSSDLERAERTAEIAFVERQLALATSELLRERNWGIYDGKQADFFRREARDLIDKFQQLTEEEKWSFKFHESIESNEEIFGRFMNFLREVALAYPGETIAVVSHLNMMEALLRHLGLQPLHVDNSACVQIRTDGVEIILEDTSGVHLADEGKGNEG
jgi:broad specificity phosphatase PhoE